MKGNRRERGCKEHVQESYKTSVLSMHAEHLEGGQVE